MHLERVSWDGSITWHDATAYRAMGGAVYIWYLDGASFRYKSSGRTLYVGGSKAGSDRPVPTRDAAELWNRVVTISPIC